MDKSNECLLIIPHFNNANELYESLGSIGQQEKIDVLIVDDGSTQKFNSNIAERSFVAQGHFFVINLKQNCGIEYALNEGLRFALKHDYELVARLDCGDLNACNRFSIQQTFLKKNPHVMLVGAWSHVVDTNGNNIYDFKHPIKYEEIRKKMYFNSVITHPTVMFRTSLINKVGMYPLNYPAAEDYAYFMTIVKNYEVQNIPEFLLNYVTDPNSISSKKRRIQVKSRIRVILDNFQFGYYPIVGLLMNIALLFLSRSFTDKLKSILSR